MYDIERQVLVLAVDSNMSSVKVIYKRRHVKLTLIALHRGAFEVQGWQVRVQAH